jgi:hypothetical protein
MAIYSKGFPIQTLTSGAASAELIGYGQQRTALLHIKVTLSSQPGAGSTFALGYPAARGVGPTLITAIQEDPGSPADVFPTVASAWLTPPTVPTGFLRQQTLDNVIGDGIIWEFSRGLMVPAGGSIVLWNVSAVGNAHITWIWGD